MSTRENELISYTFQDTGKRVLLRKVSPLLSVQLQKDFPPPKPPTQEVNYGDDKNPDIRIEENPAHPDYERQLQEHNRDFEEKMQRLLIKRGIVVDVKSEEIQEEIKDLRDFYKEEFNKELPKDDLICYVSFICVGTDSDLEELLENLMRRSQPSEVEQLNAKESFRS